mmetsp:Transcript_4643/g.14806  ORF Transcript_4643/g.14806 Transcript_4643/m.14806 type:complete len:343 (-) Transcript_4643:80-1108(-)
MMSSSGLAIQFVSPPAMGEQGAKTSSIMDLSSSAYSLQVVDMSAYTESSGEREKQRWSMVVNFLSNHMWRLMTGMPSSSSSCLKYGIVDHFSGTTRFSTSTGSAETYSSATTSVPSRSTTALTVPSSLSSKRSMGLDVKTWPPFFSIDSTMGAQRRSGWFPSKNAIWRPLSSLRKRFIAVKTTVIESLSGSMKSSAFAMEMKTSSLMRSGMPYLRMKSSTESSSCALMKSWPSMSIGSKGGAVWSFSPSVSIFWFSKIARPKLNGAGMPGTKSNVVNSPGSSCIAKTILCTFHCRRSWIPSSWKSRIMFGYAPKKMWRPVSIQSPSASCHALTLPPRTSRAS